MRPTREKIGIRKARDRFYGCVGKGKELVEARARERKKEAFAEANGEQTKAAWLAGRQSPF